MLLSIVLAMRSRRSGERPTSLGEATVSEILAEADEVVSSPVILTQSGAKGKNLPLEILAEADGVVRTVDGFEDV